MKKKIKLLVTMLMCVLIAVLTPMQAFAASVSTNYISDIKVSYGKNAEEAKKWLEGQGYKVVDADLNEEADSALVASRAVYLGYKTTRKVSEAITDLKVMNMTGNYSFAAYEMVLEEQASEISAFVTQLTASLKEYRENYKNGLYKAVAAHDLLDLIYDDDTDNTMGELLLNETVQEMDSEKYDALSDADRNQHADMVKILMQGNSSATLAMEQYLCMASDTADNSFIDRLSEMESYDEFETAYAKENGITNGDAIEKALAAEYDDTALAIASGLDAFREYLNVFSTSEMFKETDEEKIIKYYEENGKDGDYMLFCNSRSIYMSLQAADFEGSSLYDFIAQDSNDFEGEERYMLYPLCAALSDGQRACIAYVSLAQLFNNGILDNDAWKTNYDKIKAGVIDKTKTVSAYAGINRELFGNGVALTNAAKQLNESSTKSYMDYWLTDSISDTTYYFLAGFAVSAIASVGCRVVANMLKKVEANIYATTMEDFETMTTSAAEVIEGVADDVVDDVSQEIIEETFIAPETTGPSYFYTAAARTTRSNLLNIGNVCCVLMLVFAAFTIAGTYRDLYNYYHTDKTPIPAYMVDEVTNEKGENSYTYYTAATCNRVEKGYVDEKSEILEAFADLNGDIGKEWLALYYTKDASAGKPIKADFLCLKGKNTTDGKTALTIFGEKNALNLVDERFTFNDEFSGIFLFYSVGDSIFTSSAVSSGTLAIFTVVAVVIGFVPTFFIRRKKNKVKEA